MEKAVQSDRRAAGAAQGKRGLLERVGSQDSVVRTLVSKVWRRYALRDIRANDNHTGLDRLYALPDPWGMTSLREQSRFAQTNTIVVELCGRVGSLLEIGCGEGHQSEYLARLCDRLYGFDVSARAVSRAQARFPQSEFGVGDLSALPWNRQAGEKYDLVVACEVLYYLSDIDDAVRRMSALGKSCLVTFFSPAARLVAEHVIDIPGLRRGWIYHDPYAWLWAYWKPGDMAGPR